MVLIKKRLSNKKKILKYKSGVGSQNFEVTIFTV